MRKSHQTIITRVNTMSATHRWMTIFITTCTNNNINNITQSPHYQLTTTQLIIPKHMDITGEVKAVGRGETTLHTLRHPTTIILIMLLTHVQHPVCDLRSLILLARKRNNEKMVPVAMAAGTIEVRAHEMQQPIFEMNIDHHRPNIIQTDRRNMKCHTIDATILTVAASYPLSWRVPKAICHLVVRLEENIILWNGFHQSTKRKHLSLRLIALCLRFLREAL